MKKALALGLLLIGWAVTAGATVTVGAHVSYFSPADADFRSIYGGGALVGGGFSFPLADRIDLWFEGGYFGKTGSLTYTLEETKLTLVPLGIGVDYYFIPGKIHPYIGAGVRLVFFHETNVLGDVKDRAIGGVIRAGLAIPLSGRLGSDLRAAFSFCRMQPADFEFSVGGLELGAGLTYRF